MIVAAVAERLNREFEPPTAPVKVITLVPVVPASNVKAVVPATLPSIVPEKLMFAPVGVPPLFVVSNVIGDPESTRLLATPMVPPLVVIFPPMVIAVVPV